MNPFVSRLTNNQTWIVPVSALSLVLGFMIVMVSRGSASRIGLLDPEQQRRLAAVQPGSDAQQQSQMHEQGIEINKLRGQITQLENTMAESSNATKVLNDSLQEAKFFAGLTEVEGPGVLVTLSDGYSADSNPPQSSTAGQSEVDNNPLTTEDIIHDQDILRVVNELYAAGAESVSINNLRLVSTSSVRCVGNTVLIDGVRIASPIKIRAVGDSDTLLGALRMPGGIVEELRSVNPHMITLEPVKNMTLPAYAGVTTRRYAKVTTSAK
jgi:uncharacterized protein YlxW (UPF0749 family)